MFLIIVLAGLPGLMLFIYSGNLILNFLKIPDSTRTSGKKRETCATGLTQSFLGAESGRNAKLTAPPHIPAIYRQDKRQELLS